MAKLSICIPTYNRATYLNETLLSITNQERFVNTNDVEVVISDNCSEDNTKEIALYFISQFDGKISYNRNSENIKDANFSKVLSLAKGQYLKLNNDTLYHKDGSLDKMLEVIEKYRNIGFNLYFSNNNRKLPSITINKGINDLVTNISYLSTWIGGFGIWKEDFDRIEDFDRYKDLQLTQTDVLFRLSLVKPTVVINDGLFESVLPAKKGGYDVIKVFLKNYTFILEEHKIAKSLTNKVYSFEQERLLMEHIYQSLINSKKQYEIYTYTFQGYQIEIIKHYANRPLLLIRFFIRIYIKYIKLYLKNRK